MPWLIAAPRPRVKALVSTGEVNANCPASRVAVAEAGESFCMFLGDILVAHKLVTLADVAAAIEWQKREGGRLGDILVAQGKLRPEDLETILHGAPTAPRTLAETGLALPTLLNLM